MTGRDEDDKAASDLRDVEAVLAGNAGAYRGLVERYQGMVAGLAWRYGVRREDIEDVTSDVFIKAYENLGSYRPDHPFGTWLYRLAANHVIDQARRRKKERLRSDMPEQVADPRPGAESAVEVDERDSLVRGALGAVDGRYRDALFLVYVEGRRVDEAAAILGIPEGTMKTRLMRGREALRRVLQRRHPEHFGAPS
ncbi:MAG TPA: sigma-70 family RNA polymerase sigma factor [Candidatus Polarisedimenticolaceae bacterium]